MGNKTPVNSTLKRYFGAKVKSSLHGVNLICENAWLGIKKFTLRINNKQQAFRWKHFPPPPLMSSTPKETTHQFPHGPEKQGGGGTWSLSLHKIMREKLHEWLVRLTNNLKIAYITWVQISSTKRDHILLLWPRNFAIIAYLPIDQNTEYWNDLPYTHCFVIETMAWCQLMLTLVSFIMTWKQKAKFWFKLSTFLIRFM